MKTLITYSLYKETSETDFFLKNGIIDNLDTDYVFIVNDLNFKPSNVFLDAQKKLGSRCRLMLRDNIGYDFGGYSCVVDTFTKEGKINSYEYFVFLNQTVTGPFFPNWYKDVENNWAKLFTRKITKETKLVGISINCVYKDMEKNEYIYSPHVQSMFFTTDRIGLKLLVENSMFNYPNIHTIKEWIIMDKEIKMSRIMLENNYNIECALSCSSNYDFRKEKHPNAWQDPLFPNSYFKENVHPYETIFIKNNRNITPNLIANLKEWQV